MSQQQGLPRSVHARYERMIYQTCLKRLDALGSMLICTPWSSIALPWRRLRHTSKFCASKVSWEGFAILRSNVFYIL